MTDFTQIQIRRHTASLFTSNNPVLLSGQQGVETDTSFMKIGDGSTAWTSLKYIAKVLTDTQWGYVTTMDQGVSKANSVQFAGLTMAGNIVMGNGNTIGQAAGPLLTFDDTNNYLEITGCNVAIGKSVANHPLDVVGVIASDTSVDVPRVNCVNYNSGSSGTALELKLGAVAQLIIAVGGAINMLSLAGTGTRNVVVDASGNLTAP